MSATVIKYPVGRPTKLTPELLDKARLYLDTCDDVIKETDKGSISYVDVNLPTLVGFAQYLGINKDTVTDWSKGDEELQQEFSVLVREITQEQEKRALNKALGGIYNPKIAALILGRYGYVDKTGTDITSNGKEISISISEVIAKKNDMKLQ